jgi:hypothetical protein
MMNFEKDPVRKIRILSFVYILTMAIDVNHQLRISYLLRNGARAIRIPICDILKIKVKV